jgi:MutS domain V
MIYLYVIIAAVGVAVLVNMYYALQRRKSIQMLWDRNARLDSLTNYHETFKNFYLNSRKPNHFCVDDVTWNDLNMEKIYKDINYTFTSVGEELLYYRLKRAHENHVFDEELMKRITTDGEYRIKLSLILSGLGRSTYANSSKYMFGIPNYKLKPFYYLFGAMPFVGLTCLFISIPVGLLIFLLSTLVNSFLFFGTRSKREEEFESLFYCLNVIIASRKMAKLNDNTALLHQTAKLKRAPFVSALLLKEDPSGVNVVHQLFTLLKSIFLIDYFVFHYIIHLLNNNTAIYEKAWKNIGEIDCCYSTALWRKTLPYYCLPKYANDSNLKIKGAYHPLLSEPVGNDFNFENHVLLTGSNASGKSTFIKTIALNIILSQALHTSTSKEITLTKGIVYSSMAMADDIEKGQSYFLSEIAALKRIFDIRNSDEAVHMYLFVDEVFKGTNTIERIAAAESVLTSLSTYPRTKIIAATHDLELTDKLAAAYENYHFNEQIVNDEVIFDYLIKHGPSDTRNAIELLRITGFPNKVYDDALRYSKQQLK